MGATLFASFSIGPFISNPLDFPNDQQFQTAMPEKASTSKFLIDSDAQYDC